MYEIRALFERFWIVKNQNKELYYATRRALPQYHQFINEHLGWNLVLNEDIIKLEKVPPRSMEWMGIEAFTDMMDYCLFCALLLFLEDHDDGEQFLLSTLTAAIETYMDNIYSVDWAVFIHRKAMVRVLRYAQEIGLLLVYDGKSDDFSHFAAHEVLYENTGLSRYYAVHFGRDILGLRCASDFEALTGVGDRGRVRINRVYRQLALCPALYWTEEDKSDYEYVKNQRNWVAKYLDDALGGELHIHKNGAFFVLRGYSRFGLYYPNEKAISDVSLMVCAYIRERLPQRSPEDRIMLSTHEFKEIVTECKTKWDSGWGKNIRDLTANKLYQALSTFMEGWMLLEKADNHIIINPAAGKWVGHYVRNWEERIEPLEDAQIGLR
ncbi:MAG: TIGR02678 family protein [Defluviitaleaceae bacterium]|nr:TIGR02678 family protein [Defluviitaleaceae bacterium]